MLKLFIKLRITIRIISNKKEKWIKNKHFINTFYIINKGMHGIKNVVFKIMFNAVNIKIIQCIKCK